MAVDIVVAGGACDAPARINLCWRSIVDTVPQNTPQKQCTACKNFFPATTAFFPRHKAEKDGLQRWCRVCIKAYRERPEVQEKRKVYFQRPEVLERDRVKHKEYRKRPYVRKRVHAYLNRPEVQKRNQLQRQVGAHVRRAHQKAVSGTYTLEQIQDLLKRQKHRCYYCRNKFEQRKGKYLYHVEHTFPISRVTGTGIPANDISYLVLACPTCNPSKGDKFPWEFPEGGRLL